MGRPPRPAEVDDTVFLTLSRDFDRLGLKAVCKGREIGFYPSIDVDFHNPDYQRWQTEMFAKAKGIILEKDPD